MLNMFKARYDMVAVLLMFQVEALVLRDCDDAYPPLNVPATVKTIRYWGRGLKVRIGTCMDYG